MSVMFIYGGIFFIVFMKTAIVMPATYPTKYGWEPFKFRCLTGPSIEVNEKDGGWTRLMCAVNKGFTDIVENLLIAGAWLNEQDEDGVTALILAVREERIDIVHVLLEAGASVDIQDKFGKTALMKVMRYCAGREKKNLIKSFIVAGARVDIEDKNGTTVFDLASVAEKKIIRTAVKKRDRLVLQRYKLVRDQFQGVSAHADLVLDYEGLKELLESLQVSESNSQCGSCCLQ